jgi:adenylate kinase family enzyme
MDKGESHSMQPRIYITGASCSGVTTLGTRLSQRLGLVHVDADDHYWLPTSPPFTDKRAPEARVVSIRNALGASGWVLTGSFDGWGDALIVGVDLIVFVSTPAPIRMERLFERERQRYGSRIQPGGDMYGVHTKFAAWAREYDNPGFEGRNRVRHERWLNAQSARVLRVDGTQPPDTMAEQTIRELNMAHPNS